MNISEPLDLIIVGSGLAAHRAALTAVEKGARVIMLEKMSTIGGSTVMSGGSFAFAGTQFQEASGINDSAQLLKEDLIDVGGGEANTKLIDLYVREQLNELNYLLNKGVQFGPIQLSSGQSVPRSHPAHPGGVLKLLNDNLINHTNFQLKTNSHVNRLMKSPSSGIINQVKYVCNGVESVVTSKFGVVLATGGFSRSEFLLKLFVPDILLALLAGGKGNEGDGIVMAWEHGAGLSDIGFVKSTFGSYIEVDEIDPHTTLLPVYRGAIALNLKGDRFVNESGSYKTLGQAVLKEPQARAWQIFDHDVMSQSVNGVPSFDFVSALNKGRIIQAPTVQGLIEKTGLNSERALKAIATYNADAKTSGLDNHFERKALAHKFGKIVPIENGPFYAYLCTASINSTYAGLSVDDHMRVLNVMKEPIHGLFAAGELVGGLHGKAYMTGSSLVKALIFGKTAVLTALNSMDR